MERLQQRPRSSAEPKSPLVVGTISEKAPPPKKVTIGGVTYIKIDHHTIEVGNRRITFHPDGSRTIVTLNIQSGSDIGGDPRDEMSFSYPEPASVPKQPIPQEKNNKY